MSPVSDSIPSVSRRVKLWLVALLILFVGMELGFLLAVGADGELGRGVRDFFEFGRGGEGFVAVTILVWLYTALMAKPILFLARKVRRGVWWVLGILLVTFSVLAGIPHLITYTFLLFVTVLCFGIPPLWLTVGFGVSAAILLFLFQSPYAAFALPVVAMGFLRYPTGISIGRFLRPSRGVM